MHWLLAPKQLNQTGVDPSDLGQGKFPVDGLDIWPIITGENTSTPHEEIVLGYDFNGIGAIIAGNYKLIVGAQQWNPLQFPCIQGPNVGTVRSIASTT